MAVAQMEIGDCSPIGSVAISVNGIHCGFIIRKRQARFEAATLTGGFGRFHSVEDAVCALLAHASRPACEER
jgi:hypothetical protein